jgi:heme/copper-type cytochrome/quinol oxidase subunit 2
MQPENAHGQPFGGRALGRASFLAPALAAAGIFASLAMSAIALMNSSDRSAISSNTGAAANSHPRRPSTSAVPVVDLKMMPTWKLGSDGKRHDAATKTEFAVSVGKPVTLRIDNTDVQPHSITSPEAGVDIIALPGTHTYALQVNKRGRFHWRCMVVCDTGAGGWAMTHRGYLSGYITAT